MRDVIIFFLSAILILHDITFKCLPRNCPILEQDGLTALMMASGKGHASVVTLLLDAKADVNLANNVRHSVRYLFSLR
jgi:Ankyrin repeats (many copies)